MKQRAISTLVILLISSSTFAQELRLVQKEIEGLSIERLDRLTQYMQSMVDDGNSAGSVVMVMRNDKLAYSKAFGHRDIASGDNMEIDDMFRIASQSKAIISVAAMILQEQGKLTIKDPVGWYLPEYMDTKVFEKNEDGTFSEEKAKRKITIRHLLTHTSGLGYGYGPNVERWKEAGIQGWYFADREEPIRETVRRMAAIPLDFHPGDQYQYGYNTDVLGAVVEVASGQPLDQFVREQILDPLGMTDTHFYVPSEKVGRLATTYAKKETLTRAPDEGTMTGQGHYVEGPRTSFSGGAGLVSTADNYARFLQMMLNDGEWNGRRILSRKSVESMVANHTGTMFGWQGGQYFGLGYWVIDDLGETGALGSEGSYGWGGAYHTTYWVDPAEDMVVVYMTQILPADKLQDHAKLRSLVYSAIVD